MTGSFNNVSTIYGQTPNEPLLIWLNLNLLFDRSCRRAGSCAREHIPIAVQWLQDDDLYAMLPYPD